MAAAEKTARDRVFEYVKAHSQVTPAEIATALDMDSNSVSAALSALIRNYPNQIGRVPVGKTYRYDVSAPPAKLEKRNYRRGRHGNGVAKVGVLITVQYGRNEAVTLTMDQAEQIYAQLKDVFHNE